MNAMTRKQFNYRKLNCLINAIVLSLILASTTYAQPDGYTSLFMGHSFFRPVADGVAVHPPQAGIAGHSQTVVFAGGCNGAPLSLWNDPVKFGKARENEATTMTIHLPIDNELNVAAIERFREILLERTNKLDSKD